MHPVVNFFEEDNVFSDFKIIFLRKDPRLKFKNQHWPFPQERFPKKAKYMYPWFDLTSKIQDKNT